MKRFYVYIDASVIGGCEGSEFAEATLALWQLFIQGVYIMVLPGIRCGSFKERLKVSGIASLKYLRPIVLRRRYYRVKKIFDAVGWMRKRREEIDKEDEGLSWEEKNEKTRKLIEQEPLWFSLKKRLVKPTSVPVGQTKGHKRKGIEGHPD